jgi:hypothetical protein
VPAIHILQSRTYLSPDPGNQDAALLESVGGRWCALLESPMAQEKHEYWSTVFNTVVPDDNSGEFLSLKLFFHYLIHYLNI